jgi:hypothetical protein
MSVINDSDKGEVIRILETGCIDDVVERFNVTRPCVAYMLKKWKLNTIKIKNDFRRQVLERNPHMNSGSLARLFNVSYDAVARIRQRLSQNVFSRYVPDDDDKALIFELLKTLPAYEVAVKFEISSPTLTRCLKDWGTSAPKIKRDYRVEVIKANPNKTKYELADMLNCGHRTIYELKRDIEQGYS